MPKLTLSIVAISLIIILIIIAIIHQYLTISNSIKTAKGIIAKTETFQKLNPNANIKILVMGDSTAIGTGSKDKNNTIAGRFSNDIPKAHVETIAMNGLKLQGLNPIPETKLDHYDLIMIQVGANDIIRLTKFKDIETRLRKLLVESNKKADTVVILHSGDIGTAPIFSFPFNKIQSYRSKKTRLIYLDVTKETNSIYIDLYKEKVDDILVSDINRYYSKDLLHLTDEGYGIWYKEIKKAILKNNVKIFDNY